MRETWNCPDLPSPLMEGVVLPLPGAGYDFPDCPAAYLRTKRDVLKLRELWDVPHVFDEHLVDGQHLAIVVSQVASELKSGARMAASLSPWMLEAAHLWISEEQNREAHQRRQRELERKRTGG